MWLWVIKRAAAAADPPLSRSTNMGGGETAALNGVYLPVVATTDPLRQGAGVPFAVRVAALSPVAACASLLEVEALVRHLCPGVRLKEVYVCMYFGLALELAQHPCRLHSTFHRVTKLDGGKGEREEWKGTAAGSRNSWSWGGHGQASKV